ncbi:MAG: hypothetical protein L0220_19630 [Acidobacteria bacterium]|nr:hypothetical protein [Acidobacteriota bacterium]
MALPGLLIEYLINGALALLWLYPLLKKFGLPEINSSYLPFLALGVYVVGMIVDYIAWSVTRPVKYRIRKRIEERYGIEFKSSLGRSAHLRQAKFAIYAPELSKETAMRSSRDRIARGAIINTVLAIIINSIITQRILLTMLIGIPVLIISIIMWMSFDKASYSYELIAMEAIAEKIEQEKYKTTVG